MATTQPIRKKSDVRKFLNYLKNQNNPRNYVLATLGIHTALRISDILNLSCNDVYDFNTGKVRKTITLTEQKSGKTREIKLHKTVISALKSYYPQAVPGAPLIINPQTRKAISRVQAYRIISTAAIKAGVNQKVSPHSMRKTYGYHSWKNGISPAVIMKIYNHSTMSVTQIYLGVDQDDLNTAYAKLKF